MYSFTNIKLLNNNVQLDSSFKGSNKNYLLHVSFATYLSMVVDREPPDISSDINLYAAGG